MKPLLRIFAPCLLAGCLLFPLTAMQAPAPAPAKKTAPAKAQTPAPTAAEIADAKAKGLVWVNLSSKVYHKDGKFYGATRHGQFMTEADAQKAGYKAAQEPVTKDRKTKPSPMPPAKTK